ncbi:methyltransferase domain-containing protein [Nocardia brasiliensis]|uniref:Methyltransferase domain-containing protein n=1 Tax=Nocardia brasiliensis TaxID=37326 RepID=A0A6G9XU26_NOCBR|nr:methyltransferase domain-containing protein [Nocardia brasiliensis]QIS04333.1 methyltransferase domain-containing protein [Nocardia brasiliensis]
MRFFIHSARFFHSILFDIWDAAAAFRGRVLDIGCGLGGPALYRAQRFGVEVTGLTTEPAQARLAAQLADDADMGHLVSTMVGDFTAAHPPGKFDVPVSKAPADRYWTIDIGPLAEYIAAAKVSGFNLDRNVDLTAEGADYWLWSIAWADSQLAQLESRNTLTEAAESRLLRSIREHARMHRCITNNVYEFHAQVRKVRNLASDRS